MKLAVFLAFLLVHGSMCNSLHKKHEQPSRSPNQVQQEDDTPSDEIIVKSQLRNEPSHQPLSHEPSVEKSLKKADESSEEKSLSHEPTADESPSHQPSEDKSLSHKAFKDKSLSHEPSADDKSLKAPLYAFSASLSATTVVSDGTTIVFPKVLANVGGLYVNNSGQFVCPDDGLYVFMWSILKKSGYNEGMRCITSLRRSNTVFKNGPKTSYYDTSSSGSTEMVTIVQCQPVTAVTIVSESWSDTVQLSAYEVKSSFSGFKLQSSIAFSAELATTKDLFPGQIIRFDRVLTDFGDNFDEIHGFFRCPDNGVYVFSVSAYITNSTTPWSVSRLMKEGQVFIQGPITYIATVAYDSGSNSITAVVQCSTGQSIYVESQAAHDFPYTSYAPELTSFTGFKLYEASDPAAVAFTAVMASNFSSVGDSEVLPVNQIKTNIGGSYDSTVFAFICPDNAYYMFTWTATANYGGGERESDIHLYKEEANIAHLYLNPQTAADGSGTSGSSTHSTVAQCTTNSRFQLRTSMGSARVFLGGYTLFSGYKIPGDITP